MKRRLAIARLWHEGNSFSPVPTRLADFRRREWLEGDDAIRTYRNTATEMGAAVAFSERHAVEWETAFLPSMAAPPGGPVPEGDFTVMAERIVDAVRHARPDAIYLSLHGAMVTDTDPTPERRLIRAVRDAAPGATVAASFDFHANLDVTMLDGVVFASGYRTYPHVDMADTAARTLAGLAAAAAGRSAPTRALRKLPVVLPSHNMRTAAGPGEQAGPMAELMGLAAKAAARSGILDVSLFGGFAYGDSPFAGPSVMVHADGNPAQAGEAAEALRAAWTARLDRFRVDLPGPAEGLAEAVADLGSHPAATTPARPIAVLDPADNPMSGGIGDTPALLAALLANPPAMPTVFAFLYDPDLVARAHRTGIGATWTTLLGGRLTEAFGPPASATVRVQRLTDGRFVNRGPMERGLAVDLGRTCLLDVAGIALIVTETCQSPNDLAYFELHGIDLAATRLLCCKAKNHFRAAFGPLCRRIIDVDCPGPATANLAALPYRHLAPGMRPAAA